MSTLTLIPRDPANYAVRSAEEFHSLWSADKSGDRHRNFTKGDYLLANTTRAQLVALGYTTQEALLWDVAATHDLSIRWLKYLKKVAKTFPAASVVDEYGEVLVSDLRDLDVTWAVYRAASETNDPVKWVIRAADEDMSVTALLETYHVETGKSATVTTAEQTVRQGEAVLTVIDSLHTLVTWGTEQPNVRADAAVVTITQNKVQEGAQMDTADLVNEIIRGDIGSMRREAA